MSVLIETTLGDLVVDLNVEKCPISCENFLKLCKLKFYNFCPFYNVTKDYTCQTGDPNFPKGDGGRSAQGVQSKKQLFFHPETNQHTLLRHHSKGTVSMAMVKNGANSADKDLVAGSQFIITLADDLTSLDSKASVFGQVVEGLDTIDKINNAYTDEKGRPWEDIRIKHTYVLEDPFPDPPGFVEPKSPEPSKLQLSLVRRTEEKEHNDSSDGRDKRAKRQWGKEAYAQALTLEVIGDLPSADITPDENTLFVCKLNSVTQDEDLELIFSRFGDIKSCHIVRDKETGESLQYAFIKFADRSSCETAYYKMQSALIDDRRIHVDFSQSVAKMKHQNRLREYEPSESRRYRRQQDRSSRHYR